MSGEACRNNTYLAHSAVKLLHFSSKQITKLAQYILVPRVIFQADLRLHLAKLQSNGTKVLARLRRVVRLS